MQAGLIRLGSVSPACINCHMTVKFIESRRKGTVAVKGRTIGTSNELQNTMMLLEEEPQVDISSTPKARPHSPASHKTPSKVVKKSHTPAQVARIRTDEQWLWVDNMQYQEPKPLNPQGECGPNGKSRYTYHTGPAGLTTFLKYLRWIASTGAVFALDFETGPCKTTPVDKDTGDLDLARLAYSTDPKRYGSDPHTSVVFLASISIIPGQSHVIDVREMRGARSEEFAHLLGEACTRGRMIAHNAVFESVFVKALTGIYPVVYSDTMIKTRICYAGLVGDMATWADPRKPPPFLASEEACLRRELGIEPDKKWQKFFLEMHPESGLLDDQIAYVAGDTAYLMQLNDKLDVKLASRNLSHIWETIERPFLPIVAKSYYEGVKVDVPLMIQYRDEAQAELDVLLPQWKALKVKIARDSADEKASMDDVNYESVKDLVVYFQKKYPKRTLTNRQGKVSIDDDILQDLVESEQDQVAALVRELRIVTRVLSTYLNPWIETHRNPVTGNIHCTFAQCDTATGRMSAKNPNLQNLPSKSKWKKIRNCFIAEENRLLIDRDLSQFEIRALADMSKEEPMMDFFRSALKVEERIRALWAQHPEWGIMSEDTRSSCPDETIKALLVEKSTLDFHSLNAAAIFEDAFTKGSDSARSLMRKQGKGLSFGIPYGVSAVKIAADFKISSEAAQALIDKYYSTWAMTAKYLESQKYDAREKNFSISPTKRLRFYPRRLPATFSDKEKKSLIRGFERQGQNFSVQSINGDVLKVASILMQPFLIAHGARIVLWVHDEILVECPSEFVSAVADEMERCMIAAAPLCGLHTCPIETSVEIGTCWQH